MTEGRTVSWVNEATREGERTINLLIVSWQLRMVLTYHRIHFWNRGRSSFEQESRDTNRAIQGSRTNINLSWWTVTKFGREIANNWLKSSNGWFKRRMLRSSSSKNGKNEQTLDQAVVHRHIVSFDLSSEQTLEDALKKKNSEFRAVQEQLRQFDEKVGEHRLTC